MARRQQPEPTPTPPAPAPALPTCPMLVITYTNRVFYETALGFHAAIRALGIPHVEVWGDMSPAFGDQYTQRHGSDEGACALPLQLAIAPHEDAVLLPQYVVLHLEQTWSVFSSRDKRYKQVVENAMSVWLMSGNGMQSFAGLAIDPTRIFVVPLYTRFDYAQRTRERGESDQKIDRVAMLGSHTQRRERVLEELQPLAAYLWGAVADPSTLYFSRERDLKLLRSAKVHHLHIDAAKLLLMLSFHVNATIISACLHHLHGRVSFNFMSITGTKIRSS